MPPTASCHASSDPPTLLRAGRSVRGLRSPARKCSSAVEARPPENATASVSPGRMRACRRIALRTLPRSCSCRQGWQRGSRPRATTCREGQRAWRDGGGGVRTVLPQSHKCGTALVHQEVMFTWASCLRHFMHIVPAGGTAVPAAAGGGSALLPPPLLPQPPSPHCCCPQLPDVWAVCWRPAGGLSPSSAAPHGCMSAVMSVFGRLDG